MREKRTEQIRLVAGRPGFVLVVDDDPDFRGIVRVVLENYGYEVAEAGNIAAALLIAKRAPPAATLVDLTLADESGEDLIARIRLLPGCRNLPAIAVSGCEDRLDSAARQGFVSALLKPVTTDDLIAAVTG